MHLRINGFELDIIGVLIFAIPFFAALFLTFLIAFQSGMNLADCLNDRGQFVVMPRNCYLKIP